MQQDDDFLAAFDEIENPSVIAAGIDRVTLGQRISKDNVASKSNPQKGVGNNKAVRHLAMDAAKLSMWLDSNETIALAKTPQLSLKSSTRVPVSTGWRDRQWICSIPSIRSPRQGQASVHWPIPGPIRQRRMGS